eukprot:5967602-Pyramimonas_sp.AAC.1
MKMKMRRMMKMMVLMMMMMMIASLARGPLGEEEKEEPFRLTLRLALAQTHHPSVRSSAGRLTFRLPH